MSKTIRLTMAQALAKFLTRQMTVIDGKTVPIFAGVWAIFGHGNVAGFGEALYQIRDELPTYRAHNEQGMAHAAIAFAKASFRRRFMACTTSIGPGATNLVTAAALAHVNRLPVLFLPGDVFASRAPDPVLQQVEDFAAVAALKAAKKPVIIGGGGVLYSGASETLAAFADKAGIPVLETQGGKSALADDHPLNMGSVGVTGTSASNRLAAETDLILAVGTRLQDFTTGSWAAFGNAAMKIIGLNTQIFDAGKHRARPLIADAKAGLEELSAALGDWTTPRAWTEDAKAGKVEWRKAADNALAATNAALPSDAQVIGAVQRVLTGKSTVVCAAGGLPGELHKLWRADTPGGYHLEYGYSCMGYEIAGGLGVKMAKPDDEVVVMVGDGSYLMLNSELATLVMLGLRITVVLLDNRGYGCINRLQMATGGANFNNLLADSRHVALPAIDFRAHAESLGAIAVKVASIAELEQALATARGADRSTVIVIDTDALITTQAGGAWWDVAVPEVSPRRQVNESRKAYEKAREKQL
ncbi:MAG: hypothetical protein IPL47_02450 [Phyllobacteriaceae bacterium]|nr:hypothetical protein [Phyllobacteriaceae bacterium]